MDLFTGTMLVINFVLFSAFLYFSFESFKEQESRATKNGITGALFIAILTLLIFIPQLKTIVLLCYIFGTIFTMSLLIPATPNAKALKGAKGYLVGEAERFDERDSIFARHRGLVKGDEHYNLFYKKMYPEKEERDEKRREIGILGKPGNIDNGYQPNVAMMAASFSMPMRFVKRAREGRFIMGS